MISCLYLAVLFHACMGSLIPDPPQDAMAGITFWPGKNRTTNVKAEDFKYKYIALGGEIYDDEFEPYMLEVAATLAIPDDHFQTGTEIVADIVGDFSDDVFLALAYYASVGFFTAEEGTTIFPEYEQHRDRPECEGTCAGACSDTCTADGRKYDTLAGVGGVRATCVNDNFMCTANDPYYHTYSVLVHEFAHTLHQYALPYSTDLWDRIYNAWYYALQGGTWDPDSYAMSNHLEYFAEGAGVFFNVNFHATSSGGMNSCGRPAGQFCESEYEARSWLYSQDIELYSCLLEAFLGGDASVVSGLTVCPE